MKSDIRNTSIKLFRIPVDPSRQTSHLLDSVCQQIISSPARHHSNSAHHVQIPSISKLLLNFSVALFNQLLIWDVY